MGVDFQDHVKSEVTEHWAILIFTLIKEKLIYFLCNGCLSIFPEVRIKDNNGEDYYENIVIMMMTMIIAIIIITIKVNIAIIIIIITMPSQYSSSPLIESS